MTELKAGYKQTEVGVIPEDWEVKKLIDISTEIGDGIHATPRYVGMSNYFFVNGNNLVNKEISIYEDTKCVSEKEYNLLKKKLSSKSILMSINGTIGNLAFFNNENIVLGKSAAYINLKDESEKIFVYYILQHSSVKNFYENELTGTTIRNLSLKAIRETPIISPTNKAEQAAIATALSDVDALISALDNIIAKKRLIKQGAMQELLSGKKRLAGFSGEWEVKKLGDITEIDSDNLSSSTSPEYIFNYISLEDVDFGRLKNTTELQFKNSPSRARRKIKKGDVLVSTVRPNLKSHLIIKNEVNDWICSTGFSVIRCNNVNSYYIFNHFFSSIVNNQIETIITGSNYPAINSTDIKNLLIPLPPTKKEQTAIAQILSDMDSDIQALETQRNKTQAIKQGMMQNLLTGKIRLI
jgi:type I restriction enzyme S subunit